MAEQNPRFLFYGHYTDRWGDLMTWSGYADDEADAMLKLRLFVGAFTRDHKIDPEWTWALYDDGTWVSRADYERSRQTPAAAE